MKVKPRWEDWQTERVRKWYGKIPAKDLALEVGRSERSVVQHANRLGLRRPNKVPGTKYPVEFYRTILLEYGLSTVPEIAARRGVGVNTVRSWVSRAMVYLDD